MYDMDLCKEYVEMDWDDIEESTDFILGAIRLDGRIWILRAEPHGRYFDWFEADRKWPQYKLAAVIIDRHDLEMAHGASTGNTALQNGAL